MTFEINERVEHPTTLWRGTVTECTDTEVTVLWDADDHYPTPWSFSYTLPTDEVRSLGVVNNPPAHSCSIRFFEPLPDATVAAAVEDTIGMKYDADKPRMDLLLDGMPGALEQVASILTFGAKKYADHSWQGVPNGPARYKAALLRHLTAHAKGEKNDPESGMPHLAHAACNALFILQLEMNNEPTV